MEYYEPDEVPVMNMRPAREISDAMFSFAVFKNFRKITHPGLLNSWLYMYGRSKRQEALRRDAKRRFEAIGNWIA